MNELRNKSREELFDIWKKRIRVARDKHDEKVVKPAKKILQEYAGKSRFDQDTGERYSQIAQVIHSIEMTIQPHLYFQNPNLAATAKRPEWEKREKLVAAVVNQEYNDIKASGHRIDLENELAVLDARLMPFGATKTTYQVEGDILTEQPEQGLLDKAKGVFTGQSAAPIETPVIENEIGHITERVNPMRLYLDYAADHITKQRFHIEVLDYTKEDLMKPRYEQDKVENLEPNISLFPSFHAKSKREQEELLKDPDFKGYRVYEIHDIENRLIHTVVDGVDDFVEFGTPYPIAEGSQFSFLWFVDEPNEAYPIPPINFYRQRANEFSYVYSQVSQQIDKFMPKVGFDVNRLDKPEQMRLKNGTMGAMVGFNGSPQGAWDVINPAVSKDLFAYMAMTKELLFMEAGAADFEVAVPDEDRTATQDKITSAAVKSRRFLPQKRVKGFLIDQAQTIWQTMAENAPPENFIKVLGEEDALEWWNDPETGKQAWSREDIAGDYWFDFDIQSIAPQDHARQQQQNALNIEVILRPELKENLLQEGKELLISHTFAKFADENMGIKDKTKLWKELQGLEPGDEHTLWMNGQYPPISEREMKDPKFLMKHVQEHEKFIQSPAFVALPPELQQGAIAHQESYLPFLAQIAQQSQQAAGPQRQQPLPLGPTPAREEAVASA